MSLAISVPNLMRIGLVVTEICGNKHYRLTHPHTPNIWYDYKDLQTTHLIQKHQRMLRVLPADVNKLFHNSHVFYYLSNCACKVFCSFVEVNYKVVVFQLVQTVAFTG